MRRIVMVVVCLAGLACAQAVYTGSANWNGGGIWGAGLQQEVGDLPLPDFTGQGGIPLSLPQAWVDPMEAFKQTVQETVYVGNSTCPIAPARTNYKGQAKGAGVCDYADSDGTGLKTVANDWASLSGGNYDQRWDVVITHGSTFTIPCSGTPLTCWAWPAKYSGSAPTKYLVYRSDCSAATPCAGTNDVGYNPTGRTVCAHGISDMLNPALPGMGQRNHGCAGYLGTVPSSYHIPIDSAAYSYDSNYNDIANMYTLTSTAQASVIKMGPAYTPSAGDYPRTCNNADPSQPGTDYCPVEGVNHIWMTDAHLTSNTTGVNQFTEVNFDAYEWQIYQADITAGYLGAVANHVGLSQVYVDGTTDDDGFGLPHMVNGVKLACAYCALTHSYVDGVKADGGESHAVTLSDGIGPIMVADDWIESGSIGLWGGGGGNPSIRGVVPADVQITRTRITYHKRWLPPPAGNHPTNKPVTGGSCSGSSLSLAINNAPGSGATKTNLAAQVVYLKSIKTESNTTVTTNGWYNLDALPAQTSPETIVISATNNSGFSCSGAPASGTVWGYAENYAGIPTISASAMNAGGAAKAADVADAGEKNRIESKTWQRVVLDGVILENAGVEGQSGQLLGLFLRAYSNVAYDNGNETALTQDFTLSNFIARNATYGLQLSSRSGGGTWTPYTISNITCTGTTQAAVTATASGGGAMNAKMYNAPNFLPDMHLNCSDTGNAPCTRTALGADVYLSGVGGGLIAEGWYTTAYPDGGDYSKFGTSVPVLADPSGTGTVCTTANGTASSGTIYAVSQGAGHGVSWPEHRIVYQNGLVYGIGDRNLSNGSGPEQFMSLGGSGSNFSVNISVTQTSPTLIATATSTQIRDCPGSNQCPHVIQSVAGDLAYVRCLNDDRFSSGPAGSKGVPILSVTPDELSFTYTPQNNGPNCVGSTCFSPLAIGYSTNCSVPTPLMNDESGYYNSQSFPWPFFMNHITGVGVNGFNVAGGTGTFARYANFTNSFELVPGPSDSAANDACDGGSSSGCRFGFTGANGEIYKTDDSKGVTNVNDRNTFTFKSYALSTRDIENYPMFPCGSPGSTGCLTGGNPVSYPGTNSTPRNVASPGASVTCNGGLTCNSTNYTPDSVGFAGAMGTNSYPFSLGDFRNYALHSSSPYKSGGILQATDGLDNGAQIPLIVNALSRTLYVCGLPCGEGPHRDGPQYGFLQWSPYGGAVNYRVYRDGGASPVGTITTTWFNDYGLPTGGHTWTVKAWDGTAEQAVSGLVSQIY